MRKSKLKQVAVRMSPELQVAIRKMAKREKQSFSEFVRQATSDRIDVLKNWRPRRLECKGLRWPRT